MALGEERTLKEYYSKKVRGEKRKKASTHGCENSISPCHPTLHLLETKLVENHSHLINFERKQGK